MVNVAKAVLLREPVPNVAAPSLKVTVPVGVSVAGATAETLAVNVTDWPNTEGLPLVDTVVVVEPCVTVNVVEAVLLLASVAATVFDPGAVEGTVKVLVKLPVELVVAVPWDTELNVTVVAELAAKPLPVTVADVPTGPDVGFTETEDETVSVAV